MTKAEYKEVLYLLEELVECSGEYFNGKTKDNAEILIQALLEGVE